MIKSLYKEHKKEARNESAALHWAEEAAKIGTHHHTQP